MNSVVKIRDYDTFVKFCPFFVLSLAFLNSKDGPRMELSEEKLIRLLIYAALSDEGGDLFVMVSKNDKPIGYAVLKEIDKPGSFTTDVCILYVDERVVNGPQQFMKYLKAWAKEAGYKQLTSSTRRMSGGAVRWFQKLGFKRDHIGFTQNL